jgi:hypothetical protein
VRLLVHDKLTIGRIQTGKMASDDSDRLAGAFRLIGPLSRELVVVSSGVDMQYGWEHVSVSLKDRIPTWPEMCWVKDLFWGEEECVVQFHPPKSKYVNCHPYVLHLWKKVGQEWETPPELLIGPKS